jgi:hypothetical protein
VLVNLNNVQSKLNKYIFIVINVTNTPVLPIENRQIVEEQGI